MKTMIAVGLMLAPLFAWAAPESSYDSYLRAKEQVDRHLAEIRANRMEREQKAQTYELRQQTRELRKRRK